MRIASLAAAAAMSLALVASAAPAIAHQADDKPAATATANKGKSEENKKKGKVKFALHGTVVSVVDNQLTFTVKGGKFKKLRGTDLSVTVAADAKIVRNEETVLLAGVQAGDRVNVKGKRVKGELGDEAFTATRVKATSPDFVDDDNQDDDDQGENEQS